ncbi:MAG: hypothetical protein ACRDYA_16335 [Egibacteraceae bacterium]
MVVDERTRHGLYTRLEEVLGGEYAMTLMEHLPPVGWADVATKQDLAVLKGDLAALEERLGYRIGGVERRIGGLEERIDLKMDALKYELRSDFHTELVAQTRLFVIALTGSMATIASLAFAAAQLT